MKKENSSNLYYTPPKDECFKELKEKAIELWKEVDSDNDKYGYASSKINAIKDIKNIQDNFMYLVAMFDIFNQKKLAIKLSEQTKKEIKDRMIASGDIFYMSFLDL